MEHHLRVVSLNCTGLGEVNRRLLHDFLERYTPDIVILQETWLLKRDICRLCDIHHLYMGKGKSSVPDTHILQGRPYGGLGVLWKKSLSSMLKFVDCDEDRLQPFVLKIGNEKQLMVCNVYCPNDNRSASVVTDDFIRIIDSLEICIQENPSDYTLLGGDFNTDFNRNNAQSKYLNQFLLRNMLNQTWQGNIYTFTGPNSTRSCIDHFMVDGLLKQMSYVEVLDYTAWPKEICHCPILVDIKCNVIYDVDNSHTDSKVKFKSPAWHKIKSYDSYQSLLDHLLDLHDFSAVSDCLQCDNLSCNDNNHHKQIDILCMDLTNICIRASKSTLPYSKRNMGLPNWNTMVKPLRDDSHFWGNLWKQCGKPSHGVVLDIYRKCRREYHKAIRSIKHQEAQKRKEEMAKHIAENNSRDLWKELNKLKPRSRVTAPNIDGKSDPDEICEIFYDKTKTLFNSVPSNLETIRKWTEDNAVGYCMSDITVTSDEVNAALKHLKEQKSDGHKGLWSSLIIHSTAKWQGLLGQLISAMLTHGYYANELLLSTVMFLPKDVNKNICDSDNYRGISLYSSVNKVIEWIILTKYSECFTTSDLQFSYKKGHSTTVCTAVLKEVVNHYCQQNGEVSCVLLDASKAFDRVKLDLLFEILIKRNLPSPIIRLLLDMYNRQCVRTSWGDNFSQCFSVTNGVRQGGVISPILFTLYIDELLLSLERQGLGCFVGHHYFGALAYADDVTLLAPSGLMLQSMLKVCEKFGYKYCLKFNVSKTICIHFTRSKSSVPPRWITFGSENLQWKSSVKHLGNVIRSDLKDTDEIKAKQSDFIGKANSVIANFRTVQRDVCTQIFNSQCCSFYGCEAWKLYHPDVNAFFTTWRKAVRRLWNLPYTTRSSLLPHLMKCKPIQQQIYQRCLAMCTAMLKSENEKINFISNLSLKNSGIIGQNMQFLKSVNLNFDFLPADDDRVRLIKELTLCKETTLYLSYFSICDIQTMIDSISTF